MHPFGWAAVYSDGSSLQRFNDDGTENSYSDIDRQNLVSFLACGEDGNPSIVMLDSDKQVVYRRRVHAVSDGTQKVEVILGWIQKTSDGLKSSFLYIEPGGLVVLDDDREGDIELQECELTAIEKM